jgi:uncharacterized membrane protein SpoIIM required for sporulation
MRLITYLWNEKGVAVLALIVIAVFFFIGVRVSDVNFIEPNSGSIANTQPFLFKILKNNFLVGIYIIIGSISYCIISFSVLGYSAFTIGSIFQGFAKTYSTADATILILPHGLIELIWLILLTVCSYNISNSLFSFLKNQDIQPNQIISKTTFKRLTIACLLIVVGAIVEVYFTIPIFKYLND